MIPHFVSIFICTSIIKTFVFVLYVILVLFPLSLKVIIMACSGSLPDMFFFFFLGGGGTPVYYLQFVAFFFSMTVLQPPLLCKGWDGHPPSNSGCKNPHVVLKQVHFPFFHTLVFFLGCFFTIYKFEVYTAEQHIKNSNQRKFDGFVGMSCWLWCLKKKKKSTHTEVKIYPSSDSHIDAIVFKMRM